MWLGFNAGGSRQVEVTRYPGVRAVQEARLSFVVSDQELDALHGVGPLAFMTYILLRSWMDYSTGIVGMSRPISLMMLVDYCEQHVTRGQGTQTTKPTLKQMRGAIDTLKRAGVVVRLGSELLVFRLVLASTGNPRPFQTGQSEGRVRAGVTGQSEGRVGTGLNTGFDANGSSQTGQSQGRVEKSKQGTHQRSEVRDDCDDDDRGHARADDTPQVPTEPAEWLLWFNRNHDTGYNPSSIHDRRSTWPIFTRWCTAGVTLVQVAEAIDHALASSSGPIANLPAYVDRVLASLQKPVLQRGSHGSKQQQRADTIAGLTGRGTAAACDDDSIIEGVVDPVD